MQNFYRGIFYIEVLLVSACGSPTAMETTGAASTTGETTQATSAASEAPTDVTVEPTSSSSAGEAVCGDGVVDGDEACDDGNDDPNDACLPGCKPAVCGDFSVQTGVEACDDGNHVDDDQCTNACQYVRCGDGIVGPGEGCDDGNQVDKDDCSNECVAIHCGDGVIQGDEDCDDGLETEDCNSNCTASTCGDGVPNKKAGESCDAAGESPTCNDDCTAAMCGDAKVNATAGEGCDASGETPTCDKDCTLVECGDGHVNAAAGEPCDDAGESATCNKDCTPPACGDGEVNTKAGEGCDDGNDVFGDECSQCLPTTISLGLGNYHACALYEDKSVHCWGTGLNGELGLGKMEILGDQPGELPAAAIEIGMSVDTLRGGGSYNCVRFDTGKARCWGNNAYGQLGQGDTASLGDQPNELPPQDITIGAGVTEIEGGGEHTCALIEGGKVRCWGNHFWGQLGYIEPESLAKPNGKDVVGVASAVQIAMGYYHGCALDGDGTVRCWGRNMYGQLGLGHLANLGGQWGGLPMPTSKIGDPDDPVRQIAAGYNHNCAVLLSGKVRCWGRNNSGQVGASFEDGNVGSELSELPPPDVDLGGPAVQVVAGEYHSCALMTSRRVKCWGAAGAHGNPGLGDINSAAAFPPSDVDLGGDVAGVFSHMGRFSCALLGDKTVRCWGDNQYGQGGIGNTSSIGDDETPASVGPVPL